VVDEVGKDITRSGINSRLYFFANLILEALIHRLIYLENLLSLALLSIGIWLITDGFRKRLCFEVTLDNDIRTEDVFIHLVGGKE
jgi:hypothetical protein